MTLRSILSSLFIFAAINLPAQTKERLIVANTIDKSDYFYIPKSAFADSVNAVLYQDKTSAKTNPSKTPVQLSWIAFCIDGSYNISITPEQIFFSSSHENPNPNRLFWVIEIDSIQYAQIKKGICKKLPKSFENISKFNLESITAFRDTTYKDSFSSKEKGSDSTNTSSEQNCKQHKWMQLRKCFAILNACITNKDKKITLPDELQAEQMSPKLFSYFKDELLDWLPLSFDPPKVHQ